MNARLAAVRATFFRLSARLRGGDLAQKYALAEPPLRVELFSADQMERHGRPLAEAHKVAPGRGASCPVCRRTGRASRCATATAPPSTRSSCSETALRRRRAQEYT
ncbi:MAG: hypothetical protein J0I91_18540 [Candidatus Accumulibacter sp.]|nr:hypothetical protein [Accumulibacter sp.]